MGLVAADTSGTYTPAPAGSHVAICTRIIDIGTQTTPFKDESTGEQKSSHQVILTWELSNEPMDDGRPFTISKYYTCSLHEKATLRQHLEAWRGRAFTQDELRGFHLKNILGKHCMLSVTHAPKQDGSVSARVSAVMSLPKGSTPPVQINDLVCFDIDNWDERVFSTLPDYLRKQIMQSVEAREKFPGGSNGAAAQASRDSVHQAIDEASIPF